MNKFRIILKPFTGPVNGRTNQHFNLEQKMVFRINTRIGWNLIHQFRKPGIRNCPQGQKSAFRYLIVINENNGTKRYNPVNLPAEFKDFNYQIDFTASLLNDSSVVYTNTATDAVIEDFRVRNNNLVKINKVSN